MKRIIFNIKKSINALFLRILLYFLSLILPIFIIGIATYQYSANELMWDFASKLLLNLNASVHTIDTDLKTSQEISMNFFYDETVRRSLKPSQEMTKEEELLSFKIPQIISRNKYSLNSFIDSIHVYVDDMAIYSAEGRDDMGSFYGQFYKYELYDKSFWLKELKEDHYFRILLPSRVDKKFINDSYQVIPMVNTSIINGNKAVMIVNISTDAVYRIVKKNSILETTNFMILNSENHVVICSEEKYNQPEIVARIVQYEEGQPNPSQTMEIGGRKYLLTYAKSDIYGWKYCLLTPASEFAKRADSVLKLTLILCVTFAAIGVLFSFLFTRNIYNPIKKIKETLTGAEEHQICSDSARQSVNDFEYIGRGIHQLIEHGNESQYEHTLLIREYLNNSLTFLIKGNKLDHIQVLHKALRDNLRFENKSFLCCNVLFEFKEAFYRDMQDVERLSILDGIKKVVQAFMEENTKCYVLEPRQNLFVCVVNIENENGRMHMLESVQKMVRCFEYDAQYCKIFVGIGKTYDNLNDISQSYAYAATMLSKRKDDIDFQILDAEKVAVSRAAFYTFTDENKIINNLETGNMEGLKAAVNSIITTNLERCISPEYMGVVFRDLYHMGIRFIAEKGLEPDQFILDQDTNFLDDKSIIFYPEYRERSEALLSFYGRIIQHIAVNPHQHTGDLASMIADYVHKNFNKDLYLEKIADEMGVSIKYISKVFKDRKGMNLSDYICMVRVEKMKELLLKTEMTIGEISNNVGISSRATLIRSFKKMEGITPREFRDIYKKI